jgi:outer membrane lipoprotein-sorting protein
MRTTYKLLLLVIAVCFTHISMAETAEQKGLAIAAEADKRDSGFIDSSATLTMELRNKQGDTSSRQLRVKTLEVKGDGDKGLSVFDEPADVKGTAFLTFSHAKEADEQWLYLPELKRVKRIASKNKSGPFMGSEFAYEDIASQELDKYTYKYLNDENVNGIDCYVIERVPVYENSGYMRQLVSVNKKEYRPEKILFYDRKNDLLKTLVFSDYKQYLNQYWRANKMQMENHQTGKSTILTWNNYKFRNGFSDKDFDRNSLENAR